MQKSFKIESTKMTEQISWRWVFLEVFRDMLKNTCDEGKEYPWSFIQDKKLNS